MEKKISKRKLLSMILCMIFLTGVICSMVLLYQYYLRQVPDAINLRAGSEQTIVFNVPVSGEIYLEAVETTNFSETNQAGNSERTVHIDLGEAVTIKTGSCDHYEAQLKLFGIFPYKTIHINVVDETMLIPGGEMVGIYVKMDGILVVDTGSFLGADGKEHAPAGKVLNPGDYIIEVNGVKLQGKREFINLVALCGGEGLHLLVLRDGEYFETDVYPVKNEAGEYKVGIWVRDSVQGVGTLTYRDMDNGFGALGHGITDSDTGVMLSLSEGKLYHSDIVNIQKGAAGNPGEITGMIHYVYDNILGSVEINEDSGVFGSLDSAHFNTVMEPMPIAYKSEVHKGSAYILSDLSGEICEYEIEIIGINPDAVDNRGLVIKVVDEDLIELTGGIVQGMSGSPIIQDGKIVGAVTHVLVRDSEKGYGIFIEDMLEH